MTTRFQGLRTVIFRVRPHELTNATAWYTGVLGKKPYFEQPFYVGFNVGGFELGLDPSEEPITLGDNVQAYWGVKDIRNEYTACLEAGAKPVSEPREVGEGIQVAVLRDPFGNILGLIENPGFKISSS